MACILIHTLACFVAYWIVVCVRVQLFVLCTFTYIAPQIVVCLCMSACIRQLPVLSVDGKCYTWAMHTQIWVSCLGAYNVLYNMIELKYSVMLSRHVFHFFLSYRLLSLTNRTTNRPPEPPSDSDPCFDRVLAQSTFPLRQANFQITKFNRTDTCSFCWKLCFHFERIFRRHTNTVHFIHVNGPLSPFFRKDRDKKCRRRR